MRQQIAKLKENEETLRKENELLIVKLADVTIANERLEFENREKNAALEINSQKAESLQAELNAIKVSHALSQSLFISLFLSQSLSLFLSQSLYLSLFISLSFSLPIFIF